MKTIIAATDDSSDAHYAGRFAACFHAHLLFFNAFQLDAHASNSLVSSAAVAQMKRNNEKRLAELGDVARTYQIKVKALPMPSMVEEEWKRW